MSEEQIGKISHYFGHIHVAAVELTDGALAVGDNIHIKGHTTDLSEEVKSIEIEHEQVVSAKKGESIGITVPDHVREHDVVFKVVPD
jgi:translation elongation factor EF-1alpha